jgi:hypothetical protein
MSDIYQRFLSPGAAYRGKPFWAWNGALEKEEVLRQIHVMRDMGFGGFFMHSRTGLSTPYLGEEWFALINACADEAMKLGMEAWLYDEDRWPSGTAGGMVTSDPRYRMRFLRLTIGDAQDFSWSENLLAAFACRLEGLAYVDCQQLSPTFPFQAQPGLHVLSFSLEEMARSTFYNGFTYLDTLNRAATDRFLELTHEKYQRSSGEKFGSSIRGIFTDEPHRGALMDGFSLSNPDAEWLAPWTPTLFDDFQRTYGYDLVSRLPELFLQPAGVAVSQVKWQYVDLLQRLFLQNFAEPLNAWCKQHDLILTGHVLEEGSLSAQTAVSGSVMRYYEHMEYPGVDVLSEGNRQFWLAKQLSSVARQLNKPWMLSELYGGTGWQMSFESHKAVGDWQALFGINLRCHHLSWYTMQGEAKRDYPASILHQSAWWQDYDYVETYFSRIGLMLQQGRPLCDVLVLNPVESVWCQVYPGWSRTLTPQSPAIKNIETHYSTVFSWLAGSQIDFDYADEEMLSRLSQLHPQGPELKVGAATYTVVIVSGMATMRSSTLAILRQFLDLGGQVLFVGDPPSYIDALPSEQAKSLADRARRVPFARDPLLSACEPFLSKRVTVYDRATGLPLDDIYCQVRVDHETRYAFLLNMNREKAYAAVQIRFGGADGQQHIEEWNCATGKRTRHEGKFQEGNLEITVDFPAAGEHLFIQTPQNDEGVMAHRPSLEEHTREIVGPYAYRLSEPNVCVLDLARYCLNGANWQEETEILKVDRNLRGQLDMNQRGGEMLQPWFTRTSEPEIKGQVTLCFDFFVKDLPSSPVTLVMEQPQDFVVRVNNACIEPGEHADWWVDRCFKRLSIPLGLLRPGLNTVQLDVAFHEGIDLEALYLLGAFGVQVEATQKRIVGLPAHIQSGDLTTQGFPFYSGNITYLLDFEALEGGEQRVFITTPDFAGACVKVRVPDGTTSMIAWQPYEAELSYSGSVSGPLELDVVLTRRNTFGPLHLIPALSEVYGPEHWRTEGTQFSPGYILLPTGLLRAPHLSIR